MPHKPFAPKPPSKGQRQAQDQRQQHDHERRAPRAAPGSVRWLRGLLVRPLALERRGMDWHMVLVDRRRARESQGAAIDAVREELRLRLLGHDHQAAAQALRHLVQVHDALGRSGWAGVEALSARTVGKSLLQTQMLLDELDSEPLAQLRDRLRVALVAAELREERQKQQAAATGASDGDALEVSETTQEEFDASERSWVGTVPQVLPPPERG